jgi:hypothetical protein
VFDIVEYWVPLLNVNRVVCRVLHLVPEEFGRYILLEISSGEYDFCKTNFDAYLMTGWATYFPLNNRFGSPQWMPLGQRTG